MREVIAFIASSFATFMPAYFTSGRFDKMTGGYPSSSTYIAWSMGCAAIGIPLGHLSLWLFETYLPTSTKIVNLAYLPECVTVAGVLAGYLRLMYVRQWQFRLDTERMKREAAEHGQALAQAQLKMLQAQIEPHFLFNTLASVQHLVRKDTQLADFMLTELIKYLRQAVPDFRGMGSTLGRECGLVESYLNIAKIRMGERLTVKVDVPDSLADISFPALITQTLVENAIKHGIEPKIGPVSISVVARQVSGDAGQFIEISVTDDGVGFGVAETKGTGIGLRNVKERLAGLYGAKASLEITSLSPSGVRATVRIPKTP